MNPVLSCWDARINRGGVATRAAKSPAPWLRLLAISSSEDCSRSGDFRDDDTMLHFLGFRQVIDPCFFTQMTEADKINPLGLLCDGHW